MWCRVLFCISFVLFITLLNSSFGDDFTKEDKERLVRIEATLKVFMEQVDRRFEQINTMLVIISTVFGGIVVAIVGFALWDRRTMIERAKNEIMKSLENDSKLTDLINALKEFSNDNPKLAETMRKYRLL